MITTVVDQEEILEVINTVPEEEEDTITTWVVTTLLSMWLEDIEVETVDTITIEDINEEEVAEVVIDHIKAEVDIITTITILMKTILRKKEVIK